MTLQWYVEYYNYDDFHCVRECNGPFPCNGRASSYKGKGVKQDYELYATFNICCEAHTWWNVDCDAYDENGTYIELDSLSGEWYVEYVDEDPVCVRECEGAAPCNGRASSHKELHKSFDECCVLHLWWNVDCSLYDEDGIQVDNSLVKPCSEIYWTTYFDSVTSGVPASYYPDFSSDDNFCVNDENAPAYMETSPFVWKHQTLAECCWQNFQWKFKECMGDILGTENSTSIPCSPPPELSGKVCLAFMFFFRFLSPCTSE